MARQIMLWTRAVSAASLLLAMPLGAPSSAQPTAVTPVYIDSYVGTTAVHVESGRFTSRPLNLNGVRVRALVTDVGAATTERLAAVSLALSGFETFQVTVGRDDSQTGRGPGLAYFEVWGDDKLLARSPAIASSRYSVRVGAGSGLRVRRNPEQMEVSVRGIRRLRLVTRYASDIEQQAPQVAQARGCVWGDARLTPTVPSAITGRGAMVVDPVRDALRIGVIRLTNAAISLKRDNNIGDSPDVLLPMKVGVTLLQYNGPAQSAHPPEALVRAGLEELINGARLQNQPVFSLLERREASRLTDARTEPDDTVALTAAGRRSGADIVVSGVYTPGQNIALTATLVQTGKPLMQITIPIVTP